MSKQNQKSSQTKYQNYFDTDNLTADLKKRSIRGGAIVFVTQFSKFCIQMGSTVILARLLTPDDYGLIGMATVIVRFVQLFKDLGLSDATIQQSKVNHQQISTLFWINIAFSCLIALIVAAISPLVANFYHQPKLEGIVLALASIFIFSGLSVQHQALLKRKMQFAILAKIEIISLISGVSAAIVSAVMGSGYWALVILQLVTVIANSLCAWIYCRWRPSLPSPKADIGSMLAFGGNLSGFNAVNYFARNLDNILIGRIWGVQPLGIYERAYQLILLPIQQINNPIGNVAVTTLSRLQNQPDQYRRYYFKAILLITTIGMPMVAFMFACTKLLILAVLGEQWLEAVLVFRCLAPAAFIGTINVAEGWVYQSLAFTDRMFRWGIVFAICNVLVFVFSVRGGIVSVAIAYSIFLILVKIPSIVYCYHKTPLKLADLIRTIYRPAIAAIGAAGIIMLLEHWSVVDIQTVVNLLIYAVLYSFCYIAFWLILPNGRSTLLNMIHIAKNLKTDKQTT